MDFYDDLKKLVSAFETAGIDYAICGGVALAFLGYPRFTKGIDILIQAVQTEEAMVIAEQAGFLDAAGRIPFEHFDMFRTSKIVNRDILVLDLLIVNEALRKIWEDREVFEWDGVRVHVVSKDGLIAMKRMAGRAQDLVDIQKLNGTDAAEN